MTLNPKFTDEILLTDGLKARLSDLGYKATTFEDLIIEIITKSDNSAKLGKLEQKVGQISTSTLKANTPTFGLGTGAVDSVALTNRSVEYKVEEGNFTYDLSKFKKELPTGFSFISGGVTLTDSEGKNTSAKGSFQTLKVNSLPVTAVITATVKTENGTMNLDRTLLLTKDVSTSATLDARDTPAADTDLYQADFNKVVAATLISLQQKIS